MIKKKIKARLRKSKKDLKKNFKNFFYWVKGEELIAAAFFTYYNNTITYLLGVSTKKGKKET